MTAEELKQTYSKLSTTELLSIVDNKFDYTELAVTIAIKELSTRDISEEEVKEYKEDQLTSFEKLVYKNIVNDLSIWQKNLFYFLWIPILHFAIKQNFRDDGYILKLKQANYYSLFGFISFMFIGMISGIYDFNNLTSIAFWILSFLVAYAFDEIFNRQSQIRKLKKLYRTENKTPSDVKELENGL